MPEGAFAFGAEELCDFYQLRSLDPKTSWNDDSSVIYRLSLPQDENSVDSSYAVLNELLRQEHEHSAGRTSGIETAGLYDPLNSQFRLEDLLDRNKVPHNERYKYYINSKKFSSKLYLRNLHAGDAFEDLASSLDLLDRSLQSQSEDLKRLVQHNFVKYVRSKNNLDRIYDQFNKFSLEGHNDLGTKELGAAVDDTIRDITLKVKPILDTNTKVKNVQTTIAFIQEHREFFDIPRKLKQCLLDQDFISLLSEYHKAQRLYQNLKNKGYSFSILQKLWSEIENIIQSYQEVLWDSLNGLKAGETQEHLLPLISKLLDLDVEENPILKWIDTKLNFFESRLEDIFDQILSKIVQAQEKAISGTFGDAEDLTFYYSINSCFEDSQKGQGSLQSKSSVNTATRSPGLCDTFVVVEMWLLIAKFVNILSNESENFVEFWEHVEKFLDGTYQTSLVNDKRKDDILGASSENRDIYSQFLKINQTQISSVRARGEQVIKLLCDKLASFFTASQASLRGGTKLEKDSGLPTDYGFLPPNANCLSCLRYLPRIVEPILKFTTELAQLGVSSNAIELLRKTVAIILDRSVSAISSTKLRDISSFHSFENWTTYRTLGDQEYGITQFPEIIHTFQNLSIMTVRNMLFSYEKLPVLNGIYVVTHPSRQLLTGIEVQQIISMEAVLESVLKDAAKEKEHPRNPRTILTLTNLQYIRERIFPQILQCFDECFETQLSSKNLEIFTLLAKMETSIFGNYLSDLKVNLRDILEARFYEINWATYQSNSFRVGDYIIEALMVLVSVHSECFRIGPQLIDRILQEAQLFISRYLFEAFKPYSGNLSSDGLLQVVVDLQFFLRVLGPSLEKDTEMTLMACLQNCFESDTQRLQTCSKETEAIVTANLKKTSAQFASFK